VNIRLCRPPKHQKPFTGFLDNDCSRCAKCAGIRKRHSQEEVGTFAGLSRASVANIEKGRQRVMLHHAYLFADFLDVPLNELLPNPKEVARASLGPAEAEYIDRIKEAIKPHKKAR
jgi:transcriptional regulator with XRE-family HTH domain